MAWENQEDENRIYHVVMNHEEQYSIWPAGWDIPTGWQEAGKTGPKAECLAYIKEVWTDMTPLSVRKSREERRKKELER
jgi:MbtH protein